MPSEWLETVFWNPIRTRGCTGKPGDPEKNPVWVLWKIQYLEIRKNPLKPRIRYRLN